MGKTPKNFLDLTNERFGSLVVIKRTDDRILKNGERRTCWLCKCDCGNYKNVMSKDLKRGSVTSCGCGINQSKKRIKQTLNGKRYGKLKIIKSVSSFESGEEGKTLLCKCDCGKMIYASRDKVLSGEKKSCGCLKEENIARGLHRKYKYHNERLYNIWYAMISRCTNSKNGGFYLYGGRGISVCPEWLGEDGFENFYEWSMKNGYKDGLSIDRINTNGNYEPSNCRWTDWDTQANNTRRNIMLEYKGKTQSLMKWSKELGLNYYVMRWKYRRYGMGIEEMINDLKNR